MEPISFPPLLRNTGGGMLSDSERVWEKISSLSVLLHKSHNSFIKLYSFNSFPLSKIPQHIETLATDYWLYLWGIQKQLSDIIWNFHTDPQQQKKRQLQTKKSVWVGCEFNFKCVVPLLSPTLTLPLPFTLRVPLWVTIHLNLSPEINLPSFTHYKESQGSVFVWPDF